VAAKLKEERETLIAHVDKQLALVGYLANGVGALITLTFLGFFVPGTVNSDRYVSLVLRNLIVFGPYVAIALPLGHYLVQRRNFAEIATWLRADEPSSERVRRAALRYPMVWAVQSSGFWIVGSVFFTLLNIDSTWSFVSVIAITGLLGGVSSCALQYLLVERTMRPVVATTLAGAPPPDGDTPGVGARVNMAWALGTGVPLLGVAAVSSLGLIRNGLGRERATGAALCLALLGSAIGFLSLRLASKSVSEPLIGLRDALTSVQKGDLATTVQVDDGSEVGLLQAGFNNMVGGLRERERLREAFGTFVDPALAERILTEGVDLAGEEIEVSLFFLDVRSFTSYAERAKPRDVVTVLNQLFDVVVPIIVGHHGHANKFVGDGVLAVFGAPERRADHAGCAVACALAVAQAVDERFGGSLRIGIGVNTGPVVAGTVGGGGRLEFTVIGDTVNTAARVEAATRLTGDDVLITETTLRRLPADAAEWQQRPPVQLKGKQESVALYAPTRAARERISQASRVP
jgi:adenylate cyclase